MNQIACKIQFFVKFSQFAVKCLADISFLKMNDKSSSFSFRRFE